MSPTAEDRVALYDRLPLTAAETRWVELARTADGPVLELGAGTGRLTAALLAAGAEVTAVERDPTMLRTLRARVGGRAEVLAADVTELPAGPLAALVLLPASLVNELPDAAARRAAFAGAARRCRPDGQLGLHLLGPWWLVRLPERSVGMLHPAGEARPIEVTIEAGELDVWRARRQARMHYRFADGQVLREELDAAVVSPTELEAELATAGLQVAERFGADATGPPGLDDPSWFVVARPCAPRAR